MASLKVLGFCLLFYIVGAADDGLFELSVIHFNDFHARFEETSPGGGTCKGENCVGGFSRVYTAIHRLAGEKPNPIVLNAADNFQGTLWYNLFKWNVTQHFLNMLPTDATTLGNHEFDDGVEGVVPFLKHLKSPVVVANIDDSLEPSMQGLYNKSVVIERAGKKIGIVGVILASTSAISSSGRLKFLDESESVNREARRLLDEEGVFTVIVLSHCGYEIEQEIARKAVPGISLVVGAHSHTLLYTGTPPSGDTPSGPYPTIVESQYGKVVPVVQAWAYTQYLGAITLAYDANGNVITWQGNPLYLDDNVPQDPQINELLKPWREQVEQAGDRVLGETVVLLDQKSCRSSECSLGNFVTDAMVYSFVDEAEEGSWTYAPIAIMNAGGIRSSIPIGNITYNDLVTAQPFENTVDVGELQGKYIKDFLEFSSTPYFYSRAYANVNLMQVSGIRVVMDLSRPYRSRVTSLKLRCNFCAIPRFEDVDLEKFYRVALPSFLAVGGDGFAVISDNLVNHRVGRLDTELLTRYITQRSPIVTGLDGRIEIIGQVKTANLL